LTVHLNPYFLRINFPHAVLEDDQSSATYDPSSGYLTVTLTKEAKGQEFPDLDLLAKLLASRNVEVSGHPAIEVIASETSLHDESEELVDSFGAISLEQREFLEGAYDVFHTSTNSSTKSQLLKMTGSFLRLWQNLLLHYNCRRRDTMDSWICTQGTLPTLLTQRMMSMSLGTRLKLAYLTNDERKD
jgi:protein SHQ1